MALENVMDAEQLALRAQRIAEACRQSLDWVTSSTDERVHADRLLVRELRSSVVAAEKLGRAAGAKMAVGVFGPSQAGKSYLISTLARASDGSLLTTMGARQVDFIAKINPEGGKESTGLVTRFTYSEIVPHCPEGMPVRVGLLTEPDIIKILANSYAEDVSHAVEESDEQQPDIEATLAKARSSSGAANSGATLSVEDIYDLETYCTQILGKNARMAALKRGGFWSAAADLAPALGPEARIAFFSTLWENLTSYTDIYLRLQRQLIQLDHARVIHCEPAALFSVDGTEWNRKVNSIIDVATLGQLGADSGDMVKVVTASGVSAAIERAELAALVAELHIVMSSKPHPFFASTDLLDFPGARSRQPLPKELINGQVARSENFLRGKVAYLFERYSTERELSSMLLCVGPSNLEVVGLGELIDRWVELTHGRTAEDRHKVACSLFFVLTKFDMAFEMGAGKSVDATRWTTRIEASLLKPFGDHSHRTNWVNDWTKGRKFKNVFWLRNPNLRQDGLFDYESPTSFMEVGVRKDKTDLVAKLRDAFVSNALVAEHFDHPVTAWDSAWQLNDGGIARIVAGLEAVCRPEVKLAQVSSQLDSLQAKVRSLLARHYISSDVAELERQKKELAVRVITGLNAALKRERFGLFLALLKLDDDSARMAYVQTERELTGEGVNYSMAAAADHEMDDDLKLLLGDEPSTSGASLGPGARRERDFAAVFAENLVQSWLTLIAEHSKSERTMQYLGMDPAIVVELARELELTAQKNGLYQRIVEEVRLHRAFRNPVKNVYMWRQVAPAVSRFNTFIDHAGHDGRSNLGVKISDLQDRPAVIFADRACSDPMARLTEASVRFEKTYFLDWIRGLQASIRGNAVFLAGFSGDAGANSRLGTILQRLEAASLVRVAGGH